MIDMLTILTCAYYILICQRAKKKPLHINKSESLLFGDCCPDALGENFVFVRQFPLMLA